MSEKRERITPQRLNREIFQVSLPPRKRFRFCETAKEQPSLCVEISDVEQRDSHGDAKEVTTFKKSMAIPDYMEDTTHTNDESGICEQDSITEILTDALLSQSDHESTETEVTENQEVHQELEESLCKNTISDGVDCDRTVIELTLTSPEWEGVYFENNDKLVGDWTNILSEKLSAHIAQCNLVFKKNRCKKLCSRIRKAPFFRGKAHYKRRGCSVCLQLTIDNKSAVEDIRMNVYVSGKEYHKAETSKRQLRGIQRAKTAQKCQQQGIMTYYYDRIGEMSSEQIGEGNITHCQTPSVLRKAVSEWVHKELLHRDIVQEVLLLKEAYVDNHTNSGKGGCCGYIQYVGADPFTVILFCKEQLNLICDNLKGDYCLDATGSIMRAIPGQKRSLLYSLVLNSSDAPPVSVADLLTTDHTIPNIANFLMVVKRAVSQRHRCWEPRKLETDWSWAEIQSGCLAFNSQNVKRYLNTCWRICCPAQGSLVKVEQFTVLHICSAHMTKAFLSSIQQYVREKSDFRHFMMKSFVSLCNSTDLEDAKATFFRICIVLQSVDFTKDVMEAIEFVQKQRQTPNTDINETSDGDEIAFSHILAKEEVAELDSKTIAECSPCMV